VIQLNVRNVVVIIVIGVLGHLAFKAAAGTAAAGIPVLGTVIKTGAAA
jgi:hypothetical protein